MSKKDLFYKEKATVWKSLMTRILRCKLFCRHSDDIDGFYDVEFLELLGEGASGRVYRARALNHANRIVAVKQIVIKRVEEGVPGFIIREASLLKELHHRNIIRLLNVSVTENTYVKLVFEYLDCDLRQYIKEAHNSLTDSMTIKSFMYQILSAVAYCHSQKVIHRDLKTKNLLIDKSKMIIKVADFGLARELGDPDMLYTKTVATRWYTAPEILFQTGKYSTPIDMWGVGCIFGEMVLKKPIFRGYNLKDELEAIFMMLGTPTEETWPGISDLCPYLKKYPTYDPLDLSRIFTDLEPAGIDLLSKLICLDPSKRISAEAALKHPYFNDLYLGSFERTGEISLSLML